MRTERRRFEDGAGGEVSGVVAQPGGTGSQPRIAVILAHGAGNDMTNPLVVAVHEGLAEAGFLSVRFNFPYKERGGRAPDRSEVLETCFRRVIEQVRAEFRPAYLFIGGKSLGGRMASHLAASGVEVEGLLFLGYPLHPPGKVDQLRTSHLPRITVPMLFFAGTRDPLCKLDLLRRAVRTLKAPIALHVIEDGDHSFKVLRRTNRSPESVQEELVRISTQWIRNQVH